MKIMILKNSFSEVTTRQEILNGIEYTVVPAVMITVGVHNGNHGPVFYPGEELSKHPVLWNMKPVILRHPDVPNSSGTELDIIKNQQVGFLMNTKYEDEKLKTEVWIDIKRANELDSRLLNKIESGEKVEVSTGLLAQVDGISGIWNGESYISSANQFVPDHLAILLDNKGACSIEDGAGLLQNSETSLTDLYMIATTAIVDKKPLGDVSYYVDDFYQSYLIFSIYNNENWNYYKLSYTFNGETFTIGNETPIPVIRKTVYEPKEINIMAKENETAVTEVPEVAVENKEVEVTVEETVVTPEVDVVENKEAVSTVDSFLATAPPEIREVLNSGLKMLSNRRAELVEKITGYERNKFTKELLNAKNIEELEMIAELIPEVVVENKEVVTKEVTPIENSETVEGLKSPTLYALESGEEKLENKGSEVEPLKVPNLF